MKALITVFTLILGLLIFQKSWAGESAYARECRIAGGQLWVVTSADSREIPLCSFGEALIGAADFAEYKWSRKATASVRAYVHAASGASCSQVGAKTLPTADSNGTEWMI